jgi:solute carrier family 35 protein F1/2
MLFFDCALIKPLLHGQLISVLITGTGVFATILSSNNCNFPLLLSSCNYLLLSLFILKNYLYNKQHQQRCLTNNITNKNQDNSCCLSTHNAIYTTTTTNDDNNNNNNNNKSLHDNIISINDYDENNLNHHSINDNNNDNNNNNNNNASGSKNANSYGINDDNRPPHMIWYIISAVLDVEANFLVILAYNYTSITSVMLLDCFTIPCAMFFSYICLGCSYRYKHIIGVIICLLGLSCIIINDSLQQQQQQKQEDDSSNPVLGDILCLCGAILYAASNILQEFLVKFHNREEYLGKLGLFGIIIAVIQFMIVDFPSLETTNNNNNNIFTLTMIFTMIGFILCLNFMYINTTIFLQSNDAILFNLSLLTSDVYAVIFTYFYEGYLVSWLYFIAFSLVIIGLILYHIEKPPFEIGQKCTF